jgi:hypothetical protein
MFTSFGPALGDENIGRSGREPADAADVEGWLFAAIRRDSRTGMSVRAMAGKYQVSRRTVRAAFWPRRGLSRAGGPGWLIDMLALTRRRLQGGT